MGKSNIEWTDYVFNPWQGCQKVSPGCDRCYAEAMLDHRYHKVQWGQHGERKRTSEAYWKQPLQWARKARLAQEAWGMECDGPLAPQRPRVFCASLADVFDNQVPAEWRVDLFHLIRLTGELDYLLLTKRPENIVKMIRSAAEAIEDGYSPATRIDRRSGDRERRVGDRLGGQDLARQETDLRSMDRKDAPNARRTGQDDRRGLRDETESCLCDLHPEDLATYRWLTDWINGEPPANVWLGFTAEDQPHFNRRWPIVRDIPAKVRFCSYEPAIGPLRLWDRFQEGWANNDREYVDGLDWLICGGESGHGHREMDPQWESDIRGDCHRLGVAYFFKQLAGKRPIPADFPLVRRFPKSA